MAKMKTTPSPAEHDEVAEGVHEAVVFVQSHMMAILGAVVLAVIAILGYNYMMDARAQAAQAANNALTDGIGQLNQLIQISDPAQRKKAAEDMIAGLDKMMTEHSDSPLAVRALFLKGRAFYEIDDFDNAQKAYEQYLAKASTDAMKARGEIALGYAHENHAFLAGDPQKEAQLLKAAFDEYVKASKDAGATYLHWYAMLSMARCQEAMNRNAEAMQIYQQIIDARPAPYVRDEDIETGDGGQNQTESAALRSILNKAQNNFSFASTAQLRLDSLKGEAEQSKTAAPAVAVPVASPAPAAANP
jgi:predicted negative regulator of RcsB-dependent stress response